MCYELGGWLGVVEVVVKPYLAMDSARIREACASESSIPESAAARYCWLASAIAAEKRDLISGGASDMGS